MDSESVIVMQETSPGGNRNRISKSRSKASVAQAASASSPWLDDATASSTAVYVSEKKPVAVPGVREVLYRPVARKRPRR